MAEPTPKHLTTRQWQIVELLGAESAGDFLAYLELHELPKDLGDPRSREAMQAWILGFARLWGIPEERLAAIFAQFQQRFDEEFQRDGTKS